MVRTFEFTYRCPACCLDVSSQKVGLFRHRTCAKKDVSGKRPLMTLVAIDGEDVSRPSDPKPLK